MDRGKAGRNCRGSRWPAGKGFTLLEVLLAVILLLFGSVYLLKVISAGFLSSGVSEQEMVAVNLALEKMESVMNAAYSSILQESPAAPVPGFTAFNREVLVTTPRTNLKEVTVNVSWAVTGAVESIALVSYVSNV